jgi:hypothetical protein
MPTQLLKLMAALLDDKELRRRFNDHPKRVMNEYGLNSAEKGIILTMDPAAIATEVMSQFTAFEQEIQNATVQQGEFPPCSEDYKPELGATETEYPSPTPGVYRIRPRTSTRQEIQAAGENLEIVITGKSFARDPDPTVKVRRLSDGKEWGTSKTELFGTFRCSRIRTVVVPRPTENTILAGDYQVMVINNGQVLERKRKNQAMDPDFVVV